MNDHNSTDGQIVSKMDPNLGCFRCYTKQVCMGWGARKPSQDLAGTGAAVEGAGYPNPFFHIQSHYAHEHCSWNACNCAPRNVQIRGMDSGSMCTKPRYYWNFRVFFKKKMYDRTLTVFWKHWKDQFQKAVEEMGRIFVAFVHSKLFLLLSMNKASPGVQSPVLGIMLHGR